MSKDEIIAWGIVGALGLVALVVVGWLIFDVIRDHRDTRE